jgi:hypothetical protein
MSATAYLVAHKELESRTVTAAGAITQCRAVGYDSLQVSVAAARPWGIAKYSATTGQQVAIVTEGSCVAEIGAAVTIGQPLATDTSGRLVPATTGQFVFARALGADSAAGKFIEVHITREGAAP